MLIPALRLKLKAINKHTTEGISVDIITRINI
jgi:hypothetical protein